jgi:hypothetical protein
MKPRHSGDRSGVITVAVTLEPDVAARLDEEAMRMEPPRGRGEAIRELLRRALQVAPGAASAWDEATLRERLETALEELNAVCRYGDVVPLPALRAEMARVAPGVDRAALDAALIELERAYRVDLLVAQSPASLPAAERSQGIARPGRGLVFYVAFRR